jgi:hypothetical protein
MASSNTSGWINSLLVVLVGLLSGLILGYAIGQNTSSFNHATTSPASQQDDIITPNNSWIVEDLTCPMPGCMNPLLTCQSEVTRRIRVWLNEQLKLARPGEDIRMEIIRVHGANVLKAISGAPPDTQGTP